MTEISQNLNSLTRNPTKKLQVTVQMTLTKNQIQLKVVLAKKEKIKSNKVSGNNKMKTKPKLKFKKSYNKNTYNKFNQNLLVAVFSFQKLMFICLQTKREIRANSHESDFFPHQ